MFSSRVLQASIPRLLFAVLVLTSTLASPLAIPTKSNLHRRQNAPFAVTGITDSGTQLRLEIRDLQQNADQWNIYLLGMQRLQSMDQNDMLSWFQIAGIHGAPFADWDGVKGNGKQDVGWCIHGASLFLSWHRPYLALYESLVVAHARDAAAEFPEGDERNRYVEAAKTLRIPYWDWAKPVPKGQHTAPDSLTTAQISVNTPSGQQTIASPLYTYRFHPVEDALRSAVGGIGDFLETHRHPNQWWVANTTNNDGGWVDSMDQFQSQAAQRVFNIFANYNNYMNVSNSGWQPNGGVSSKYDSFESVHDVVHNTIGGDGGNMVVIQLAAFDPIFWLHHTNIDRLGAMWEALYPNSYLVPSPQHGNIWLSEGQVADADTPLQPFYADPTGTFHTSNSARYPKTFGYTYPELTFDDPATIRAAINQLYGGMDAPAKRSVTLADNGYAPPNATDSNSNPRDYVANIRASKNSIGESYNIHIFLGDFTPNTYDWAKDPNLVGTHGVFAKKLAPIGDPIHVAGSVMLKKTLRQHYEQGKISGLTEDIVIPYLQKHLHWRVQKMDGCEVPRESMPELKVMVISTEVQPAASPYQLAKWVGETKLHLEVTDGRPGGLCPGDEY
ncbi:Di-copper centre-containing protein [Tothia fuscella]|uniref:tyrosinase n=1 Tax=Tothia fuscella TaxID=1048955 RepID=A0A9P4NGN5_9PEZI|nr:Di-copper centre-containing protein [Tothia fuscella]